MKNTRGFTLIELMIVIAIIAIIAAIAIPNLLEARKHGNEASAIAGLKTIATAQNFHAEGDRAGNNLYEYANSLTQLSQQDLIDQLLGAGTKQGYAFSTAVGTSQPTYFFFANADPVVPTTTGDRYFATNYRGVVFYSTANPIVVNTTNASMPPTVNPVGR